MMPRVLVVDDDPGILKLVERALGSRGYQVLTADSGTEGLNQIHSQKPDIVILDKVMPDIEGFEIARRLRRDPDLAHIPIVILTGASQLGDKLDAFNAGAESSVYTSRMSFCESPLLSRTSARPPEGLINSI